MPRRSCALAVGVSCLLSLSAQHYQTDFPPDEFKKRWQRVFDRIGPNAVAVVQGAGLASGFNLPRQFNTFYYLSGIETPHAYFKLDGRTRRVTLYLPPRNERLERAEGRVLAAEDADRVRQLTGVDEVQPTTAMGERWPIDAAPSGPPVAPPTSIYVEFAPSEGYTESRGELLQPQSAIAAHPWDGRTPRESRLRELLIVRNPRAPIQNLTPILDDLRSVKSPREIALIRRASDLAGHGMLEAMRSTEPGVTEYQLEAAARYVFQVNAALG